MCTHRPERRRRPLELTPSLFLSLVAATALFACGPHPAPPEGAPAVFDAAPEAAPWSAEADRAGDREGGPSAERRDLGLRALTPDATASPFDVASRRARAVTDEVNVAPPSIQQVSESLAAQSNLGGLTGTEVGGLTETTAGGLTGTEVGEAETAGFGQP